MRKQLWFRVILMAVLIVGLGVPPEAWPTFAQQQGPMSPPPPQEPEQPAPPNTSPGQPSQRQAPPPSSPQAVIAVNSNLVDVDATVTDHDGNLVTGLKRENFRVLDEGQPQQITNFGPTDAPITVVILLEYGSTFWNYFAARGAYWADGFLTHLKPQDWVALKTFDLNTHLVQDFTQNKSEVEQDIQQLGFPTFHEAVLFDAIYQTLDQLRDVKGKKSILVIGSGYDTFSKHNLDQILTRLKETEVTIFCVGMGEVLDMYNPNGDNIAYIQAKNQLSTFARLTGGYAFFPRFDAEMPDVFNTVAEFLRFQYTLGFTPTTPQDGKYHKIVVQIVDDQGNPLLLRNKKGKKQKVDVYAREGYTAPSAAAAGN